MNATCKKKVLFLITKSNWGGAQRYVFDLATNLPKDEYEVSVALGGDGALVEKLREHNIRVIPIEGLQRDISPTKELKASREILVILKTEKPDVLHINSSKAGLFGTLLGRLAGVPRIIFTAHGWAFNEDRSFPVRLTLKYFHWLTVLLSHKTIAVSHTLKAQMNWPFVQNKMIVIHNGRAIPNFLSEEGARSFLIGQEPKLAQYQNDIWTGTIGELHPIKGHDVMIEAVAKLVAEGNQLRHLIVGNGEERQKLEALIQEKNLQDHVFFLSHIPEAAQYLKAFDIYVQPSRSEALAYTVIEASQATLPIIASRVGGIPEVIADNESGLLVESGSIDATATAIEKCMTDEELRQRIRAAAANRSTHFSFENMISNTILVYNTKYEDVS